MIQMCDYVDVLVLAPKYAQVKVRVVETINQRTFGPTYIAYGVFQHENNTVV